jgi:hypothetical protein
MIALAGCSGSGGLPGVGGTSGGVTVGGTGSVVADVAQFTDADLVNAEDTAVANHDTLAIPCWPALKKWVDSVPGAGGGSMVVSGLASGFEAGRVTVNGVGAGVPDYVYGGCGALYMKVHGQLLALIAGAAVPKL